MSAPELPHTAAAVQMLQAFGIPPGVLSPDNLTKLQHLATEIDDPAKITPQKAREIVNTLGIKVGEHPVREKSKKARRNSLCSCGSMQKFKKCCGK